jgi:hypothetical protein
VAPGDSEEMDSGMGAAPVDAGDDKLYKIVNMPVKARQYCYKLEKGKPRVGSGGLTFADNYQFVKLLSLAVA